MIIRIKGAVAQCKMNNEKCKIKEETPLGVSKIYIFLVIPLELHQ